jgi:hypothetical protein
MLLALSLAACDQGQTPIGGFDDEGCAEPTADDGGGAAALAIAVDCSFAFDDATQTVRFEANAERVPFVAGGDLNVSAALFDDELEGRSFSVSIYDDAGTVGNVALYQFQAGTRPVNEFVGDHGFTGLNWVQDPASGENVQYACFARDPADPIDGWDE